MDNKAREGVLCLGPKYASRLVLCPLAAGFEGVWGGNYQAFYIATSHFKPGGIA